MKNQYNTALTSERIKSRAKEIGMTISQLNSICELSENTIKNAGKSAEGMKAKNLFTIAEALDCSVDYLLGRSDSPKSEISIKQNDNHGLNMGIIEYSPAFSVSMQDEQQQEISKMLSDMSPRERNKLMTMIYDFHDECEKRNE